MRVRREGLGPDRSIPGDTCTERVSGVFGCSRVGCLEGVTCVSRRVGSRLECGVFCSRTSDARCVTLQIATLHGDAFVRGGRGAAALGRAEVPER